MREWRRIPFTCTYLPGKGFVPHMFVKGLAAYLVFTKVAAAVLLHSATFGEGRGCRELALGARRPSSEPPHPSFPGDALTFEDELPPDITPFRLNGD